MIRFLSNLEYLEKPLWLVTNLSAGLKKINDGAESSKKAGSKEQVTEKTEVNRAREVPVGIEVHAHNKQI